MEFIINHNFLSRTWPLDLVNCLGNRTKDRNVTSLAISPEYFFLFVFTLCCLDLLILQQLVMCQIWSHLAVSKCKAILQIMCIPTENMQNLFPGIHAMALLVMYYILSVWRWGWALFPRFRPPCRAWISDKEETRSLDSVSSGILHL